MTAASSGLTVRSSGPQQRGIKLGSVWQLCNASFPVEAGQIQWKQGQTHFCHEGSSFPTWVGWAGLCKAKGSSAAGQTVAFAAAMLRVSSTTARGKVGNVGQEWITSTGTYGFLTDLWSLGVFGKTDGFTGFVNLSLTFHPLEKQSRLLVTPMALQGSLLYG